MVGKKMKCMDLTKIPSHYSGKWIALSIKTNKVVLSGINLKELFEKSKKQRDIVITRVPTKNCGYLLQKKRYAGTYLFIYSYFQRYRDHLQTDNPDKDNSSRHRVSFFPKETDFNKVTRKEIKHAQNLFNGRPRKVLDWETLRLRRIDWCCIRNLRPSNIT